MDVRFIAGPDVTDHSVDELPTLLDRSEGFVWVDIPAVDDEARLVLTETFSMHPMALEACLTRNHVPTVHGYDTHMFLVLFSPLLGTAGHVHLLELDVVVGANYLVTVHGPLNPKVDPAQSRVETDSVMRRIREGRFKASSPPRSPTRSAPRSPAASAHSSGMSPRSFLASSRR